MKRLKHGVFFVGDHVDPKAIKMLLSALLGVGVYEVLALFLPMEYPMLLLNTLFIVTQLDLPLTKAAAVERMIGTAAAILLGLACFFVSGGQSWIIPIGLLLAVLLSYLFLRHMVNVVYVCATMLMCNTSHGHPFAYALARAVNTFIGLGIAILVAVLYSHPYRRRPVYEDYAQKLGEIEQMVRAYRENGTEVPAEDLLRKLADITALEVKMTRDTGVLSAPFRQRVIALSGEMNQMICRLGVMQQTENQQSRQQHNEQLDDLAADAHAFTAELDGMIPKE